MVFTVRSPYEVQHMSIAYFEFFAALFGRVNQEFGAKLRKSTEAKVKS